MKAMGLALLLGLAAASAQELSVSDLALEEAADGDVLDAFLEVELAPPVLEALDNGVPLTFDWAVQIIDRASVFLPRRLWETSGGLRMSYRAMSRRFALVDLPDGKDRSYPDRPRVMAGLSRFRRPLPPLDAVLEDAEEPVLRFRIRLDIGALPPALRLPSYLDDAWRLDSGWAELRLGADDA